MPRSKGRAGRPFRRARAQVLRSATHCWICGGLLDFAAPPRTPMAPSVDHVVPLSRGGHPTRRDGLRPAHYGCNSRRGNGTHDEHVLVVLPPTGGSRQW